MENLKEEDRIVKSWQLALLLVFLIPAYYSSVLVGILPKHSDHWFLSRYTYLIISGICIIIAGAAMAVLIKRLVDKIDLKNTKV